MIKRGVLFTYYWIVQIKLFQLMVLCLFSYFVHMQYSCNVLSQTLPFFLSIVCYFFYRRYGILNRIIWHSCECLSVTNSPFFIRVIKYYVTNLCNLRFPCFTGTVNLLHLYLTRKVFATVTMSAFNVILPVFLCVIQLYKDFLYTSNDSTSKERFFRPNSASTTKWIFTF